MLIGTVGKYPTIVGSTMLTGAAVAAAYGSLIDEQVDDLNKLLDDALPRIKQAQVDPALSTVGQREAMKAIGIATLNTLDADATAMLTNGKLAVDLKRAKAGLPGALPAWQSTAATNVGVVAAMRMEETRRLLAESKMDKTQMMLSLLQPAADAATDGDRELVLAIVQAPRVWLQKFGFSDDELADLTTRYLSKALPSEWAGLKTVEEAIAVYVGNANAAKQIIANACDSPLRRMQELQVDQLSVTLKRGVQKVQVAQN